METEAMKALDELGKLLDAYHTLTSIRDQHRKPSRVYAVADVMAAGLARHDIPRVSARVDTLVRNYLEAEGFFDE